MNSELNKAFAMRASVAEIENLSKVKNLKQRFESFNDEDNRSKMIPKPPKKPVPIRNQSMRDPSTVNHRRGIVLRHSEMPRSNPQSDTNSTDSSDSVDIIYENTPATIIGDKSSR